MRYALLLGCLLIYLLILRPVKKRLLESFEQTGAIGRQRWREADGALGREWAWRCR